MRSRLAAEGIQVLRAPLVTNEYGDQQRDWPNAVVVSSSSSGWRVDPSTAFEQNDTTRDAEVTVWRAYGPLSADVEADDRVVSRGETFEVDEPPARFRSPRGNLGHTVLMLKQVDG